MPIPRKPITPKTPLRVRKPFKLNGRPFSAGKPFDWRRFSVAWRRVRLLYEAGYVVIRETVEKTSLVFSDIEQAYLDELSEGARRFFDTLEVDEQLQALEAMVAEQSWYKDEDLEPKADTAPAQEQLEAEKAAAVQTALDQTAPDQTTSAPETTTSAPELATAGKPVEVEVVHRGGGWYDVLVDGAAINDNGLRKGPAEALAAEKRTPPAPTEDLLS